MRRDCPPLHRQHCLDQTCNASGGFQVSDVGLDRANQQRAILCTTLAVHAGRGLHLNRIAERRSGPVGFQIVHLRRIDAGLCQCLPDHLLLRRTVRDRRSCARPVLVDRRPANHPPDAISISPGVREPLQDDQAAALTANESVRGGIEGLAVALPRQQPQVRHLSGDGGRKDGARAPREGEIRLSQPQARNRLVHGHQRRSTVELDRHGRPGQAKVEGEASHCHAGGGAQISDAIVAVLHEIPVLARGDTRIDPGATPLQLVRIDSCVLERLPANLEQHSLLRIHQPRLDRLDSKESRIEPINPVDEPGAAVRGILSWEIVEKIAPGARFAAFVRHRVGAGIELMPEIPEVRRTREPAGHSHDGNGLRGAVGITTNCRPRRWLSLFHRSGGTHRLSKLFRQVGGKGLNVRIVEHRGIGHRVRVGKRPVQAITQLHGHQGIHPQIEIAHRGRRCARKPQNCLDLFLQKRHEHFLTRPRRRIPQPGQQVLRQGSLHVVLRIVGQHFLQERRADLERFAERLPVPGQHHPGCNVLAHQPIEGSKSLMRGNPLDSAGRRTLGHPLPLLLGLTDI